jgi:KaiC/GvpD/RAD55 family RecA-like ATPase
MLSSRAALADALAGVPSASSMAPRPTPAPTSKSEKKRYSFYSGPDYLALPRQGSPWIVKDLIPVSGLVNIYGKPKSHKSFFALGVAAAVANDELDWEGFPVQASGPVMYLQIDTPREEWARRFEALERQGISTRNIYVADMQTVSYPVNMLEQAHLDALAEEVRRIKPILVVVDTLREAHGANENDSGDMRMVVNGIVAATHPAAVVFLTHARKDGVMTAAASEDTLLMDDNRGSGYISGRMDMIIRVTERTITYKGRAKGAGQVKVTHDADGFVHLTSPAASETEGLLREALVRHPGLSQRQLAARLQAEDPERWGQMSDKTLRRLISKVTHDPDSTPRLNGEEPGSGSVLGHAA